MYGCVAETCKDYQDMHLICPTFQVEGLCSSKNSAIVDWMNANCNKSCGCVEAPLRVCADLVKNRNIVCKEPGNAPCGREVEGITETAEECRSCVARGRILPVVT